MKAKYLFLVLLLASCGSSEADLGTVESSSDSNAPGMPLEVDYSNPDIMAGFGILALMQDLSMKKDYEAMIRFTSGTIVSRYGADKLRSFYQNLPMTFSATFLHTTDEGDVKVLSYECGNERKVRRLSVVEENDTIRVWPYDVEKGLLLSE